MSNIHLLIHNIASIASAVIGIGLFFFVIINNHRSRVSLTFAGITITAFIFITSHVIGVNISDPYISRMVLMFNLVIFALGVVSVHSVIAMLGIEKERKLALWTITLSGILFTLFFIVFPNYFLLPSVPKMYFPNYYNPGILNWVRIAFLYGVCVSYMVYELFLAYWKMEPSLERSRLKYFVLTVVVGYGVGFFPNFLVYNIQIDPLIGVWFFTFLVIPFVYGAVKYELFDIKIIAKQAFWYGLSVGVLGGILAAFEYLSQWIRDQYGGFPIWITPLFLAVVMVSIALFIWRRLRESDILKSEFITVVTHKFRTPLTEIRWAAENLSEEVPPEGKESVNEIQLANYRLIELTNLLVQLSDTDTVDFNYHIHDIQFSTFLEEFIPEYTRKAKLKEISFVVKGASDKKVLIDESQIRFVLQTLLDNAINYTPQGGAITIEVKDELGRGGHVVLSITDTGIGFSKEELGRLFQKFWRSKEALKADTEGMGIGLFMSRRIVERQNGTLSAESHGEGKGSTFFMRLPLA
jgi:signal transduction histidine kinase